MKARQPVQAHYLEKAKTGVQGLDEITNGGLPLGRPTLLSGGPGCGKTVLAMEFICQGALEFGEPGLFISFEEPARDIETNFTGSQFGFAKALHGGKVVVKSLGTSGERMAESGEYTLDGLLVRMGSWLEELRFRRLALDSLNALFSLFANRQILSRELVRVFHWLKEHRITAVVTAEHGSESPGRFSVEEYLSDCVILLDHRVADQISKRRIRILKYRGSAHGVDECPFLIGDRGITVLPITSVSLDAPAPSELVSTGISGLDEMLAGRGFYRGSTVLISGFAGTGKSTIAARFAESICAEGRRCLYLSFEESAAQLARNMRSVGIDLEAQVQRGLLRIDPVRPSAFGLEE